MSRLSPEIAALALVLATVAIAAPAPQGPGGECESCHSSAWSTKKVIHPPVKFGLCLACHQSTSDSKHTFEMRAEGKELCGQCHSTRSTRKVLHPPVNEGLCLECHDPHASDFSARLRVPIFETCTRCHPSKELQNAASATKHGALDPRQNAKVCVACHDPHQSDNPRRLIDWPPEKVCLTCHDKAVQAPDRMLINMGDWLDKHDGKPELRHGPVREGKCPDCHEPHGTSEFRMLQGTFPAGPYTPFFGTAETFGLCFGCHDSRLLTEVRLGVPGVSNQDLTKDLAWQAQGADAGSRLVRSGITGFRNGDENLHARHVNKVDKGRVCTFCHDVHASENPKHIRTSRTFGNWEFKLNYAKTLSGGSCWPGCHAQRKYDRATKQENPR